MSEKSRYGVAKVTPHPAHEWGLRIGEPGPFDDYYLVEEVTLLDGGHLVLILTDDRTNKDRRVTFAAGTWASVDSWEQEEGTP